MIPKNAVSFHFRPGANQGGGVEEGKDALSRLKEKIKKHLLN